MDTGHALSVWHPCLFRHPQHAGVANLEAAIDAIKISISSEGGDLNVKMRVCSSLLIIARNLPSFFSHRVILSSILAIFHIIRLERGFLHGAVAMLTPLLSYFCGHIFFCSPSHTKRRPVYHGPSQNLFRNQKTSNWQLSWPKPARKTSRCQATRRKMQATTGSNNWPTCLGTSKRSKIARLEDQFQKNGCRAAAAAFRFGKKGFHLDCNAVFTFDLHFPCFLYADVLLYVECCIQCTAQPSRAFTATFACPLPFFYSSMCLGRQACK